MVFTTELGDYHVTLPVSLVVFIWLIWRHNHSAAWHWLAALGFAWPLTCCSAGCYRCPVRLKRRKGVQGYSFPSSHATFSTLVFGFLAVLVAREIPLARRWFVYLAAAFLIVPIAFARLYLGIHWLTDTLAGLCLGLIWVTVLGIAYNRHPKAALQWRGLLAYSVIALLATDLLHVSLDYQADLRRYQPQTVLHTQTRDQWWQKGWRELPQQRAGFSGPSPARFGLAMGGNTRTTGAAFMGSRLAIGAEGEFKSMLLC
ncbi:MAG: phosphatase PAP2 family protein [Gammaproteobacteria bacterium]|nr:phosphatase PAP2 family protein [Gammaproteobacteria bacterium]